MILRIVTAAALVAGSVCFCMPTQAQTSTSMPGGTGMSGSRNNNSTGAMGSTGGQMNSSGMNNSGSGMSGGNSRESAQAGMQDGSSDGMNRSGRMGGGDMQERQMTECLNGAVSRQQPLSTCRR